MIDFAEARRLVQEHLDETYTDEPESPKALADGFDTGGAWAPVIDWDGVLGVFIFLVDKNTGELTPRSFAEFEDQPIAEAVTNQSTFHRVLASTRARIANHPGHADQKSHGRRGSVSTVDGLERGAAPSVLAAAQASNPGYGSSLDGPTYRAAAKAGEPWNESMGAPPSGAFEENCTNVVHAFEMRMRGYDVKAAPLDVLDKYGYAAGRTDAQQDDLITRAWSLPGGKSHGRSFAKQEWRSFSDIDKEVKAWPEGGRGYMNVGKHVFSVVKRGGKAEYVEAQFDATTSRNVTRDYKKRFGGKGGGAKLIRLDDLEPTDDIFDAIEVSG